MKKAFTRITVFTVTFVYAGLLWIVPPMFNHPVSVSLSIKTKHDDRCQVFYATKNRGFSEQQSNTKHYTAGNGFVELTIPTSRQKIIKNLRIDPVTNSGEFQIKHITLRVGNNEIRYQAQEIVEHFGLVNLEVAGISQGNITLRELHNPDAQLILRHDLNEIFELEETWMKTLFYVAGTFLYLALLIVLLMAGERIYSKSRRLMQALDHLAENAVSAGAIVAFFQKNKTIIIFSFLVAFFSFGYELFNFSLSIDEEIDSFKTAANAHFYIIVGRWGLYFLNLFFQPISLMPYYPTLLALIFLSATSVIFVTSMPGSISSKMVFTMLFISNPIHSYYLTFNTVGFYYAIGMALTSLAFVLFKNALDNKKRRFSKYIFAIFLIGFSISLYQINIVIFIVFSAYYLFANILLHHKVDWKKIGALISGMAIILVSAFLFYKSGDIAIRYWLLSDQMAENTEYLDNFRKWGVWPTDQVIHHLYQQTIGYITGTGFEAKQLGLSFSWLSPIIILLAVQIFFSNKGRVQKMVAYLTLTLLILSPFILMVLNGASLPIRAMIPLTLMIALLWFVSYQHLGPLLRKLMFFAAIIILINNTFINTRLFYSTYLSWQADRDIATRIIERIYQLDPPKEYGKIKVAFSGNYVHPQNELFFKSETHGASFFEWDPGEPYRISPFFKTTGINEINTVSIHLLGDYKTDIEAMPSWPDKGSVQVFDEIVLVKFSDPRKSWEKNK